jgi:hypothetical protein
VCTLSVVPIGDRVRLAFNRDEKRTRAPGLPPRAARIGHRTAILPTDPASGGTWLAVNDAGLALAVLNVNPATGGQVSGVIRIPGMACRFLRPPHRHTATHRKWRSETTDLDGSAADSGQPHQTRRSRGAIIPVLAGADSPSAALSLAERELDYRARAGGTAASRW